MEGGRESLRPVSGPDLVAELRSIGESLAGAGSAAEVVEVREVLLRDWADARGLGRHRRAAVDPRVAEEVRRRVAHAVHELLPVRPDSPESEWRPHVESALRALRDAVRPLRRAA